MNNLRERLEARIDQIVSGGDPRDELKFLRAILADLPGNTPPTLAELRESADTGREFLLRLSGEIHICTISKCVARKDHYWVHTKGGGVTSLPDILPLSNWQFYEIPRFCDPHWAAVEEVG